MVVDTPACYCQEPIEIDRAKVSSEHGASGLSVRTPLDVNVQQPVDNVTSAFHEVG